MTVGDGYREEFAEWLDEPNRTHAFLVGCADALIAIVAQPWRQGCRGAWGPYDNGCPVCSIGLDDECGLRFRLEDSRHQYGHDDGCAWLIAARALGIAD